MVAVTQGRDDSKLMEMVGGRESDGDSVNMLDGGEVQGLREFCDDCSERAEFFLMTKLLNISLSSS